MHYKIDTDKMSDEELLAISAQLRDIVRDRKSPEVLRAQVAAIQARKRERAAAANKCITCVGRPAREGRKTCWHCSRTSAARIVISAARDKGYPAITVHADDASMMREKVIRALPSAEGTESYVLDLPARLGRTSYHGPVWIHDGKEIVALATLVRVRHVTENVRSQARFEQIYIVKRPIKTSGPTSSADLWLPDFPQ